jgi:hypothetical protein
MEGGMAPEGQADLVWLGGTKEYGALVGRHLDLLLADHEERNFEDGEHKIRPLIEVRRQKSLCHSFVEKRRSGGVVTGELLAGLVRGHDCHHFRRSDPHRRHLAARLTSAVRGQAHADFRSGDAWHPASSPTLCSKALPPGHRAFGCRRRGTAA